MSKITKREFLLHQPSFPEIEESDIYYYEESNRIYDIIDHTMLGKELPEMLKKRIALCIVGYMQDIASDSGIWRTFVDTNRKLYGSPVPFHESREEYVEYELNLEDIRFLTWYSLAMNFEAMRGICPHSPRLLELSDIIYDHIESVYEAMPVPQKYNIARGLDFYDKEDDEPIYHLGEWLFNECYLMLPAFSYTMDEISGTLDNKSKDFDIELQKRLEEAMFEVPTGPLALYISEWVHLIISGKLPPEKRPSDKEHPYYAKFTEATGGREIAYFDNYRNLNDFLIEKMGWEKGEEHLDSLKNDGHFVLMVNKTKGMLVARNVARCIADPENPYYDKDYASEHAMDLLTVRGRCPGDLLKKIGENRWLPDAHFQGSEDTKLVTDNFDFIGRCYLQLYYRGD